MFNKRLLFVVTIFFLPLKTFAQDKIHLIQPQVKSVEFIQYCNIIDSKQIDNRNFKNLDFQEMKKLVALNFIARLKNPVEFFKIPSKTNPNVRIYTIAGNFFNDDVFHNFEFENKHILRDLYYAPCVIIGSITSIDTLFSSKDDFPSPYQIIKYEMKILDNVYQYQSPDLIDKKIDFLFSTGHRIWGSISNQKFIIGNQYLIFLSITPYDFKNEIEKEEDKNLPLLSIVSSGNEYFRLQDNYLFDKKNYFAKGKKVEINEIKSLINSLIQEIANWR